MRRFRKLADSDIIGVIFGDVHGGISYANDEYLRILGYTREEFEAGRIGWATVTPPEWLPVDERAIAQATAGNGAATPYEKEYIRKDGTRIPVLVGFTLFGQEETIALILDISERKRAEEALQQADRRKDEFLAMLAHELRNPLSALSNAVRVVRTPGVTEEDRDWAYDIAERQLHNLVRLIDDLLDVSRISTGKIRLKTARLDARTVVARAVESVRSFIRERGHELTVSVQADPLPLEADPTRLEQVLTNLLNNAAKYTDAGGRIRLTAAIERGEAVFRVRDNGLGIDVRDRCPGSSTCSPRSTPRSTARRAAWGSAWRWCMLVEMHGGRGLGGERRPRQGERVHRPATLGTQRGRTGGAADERTSADAPCRDKSCRILLVDDNIDMLHAMATTARALRTPRRHGPGRSFRRGRGAGIPPRRGPPRHRPAWHERIRRRADLAREGMTDALFIALSGYTREKDREDAIRSGFDHHLSKPVEFDDLLAIIDGPRRAGPL